METKKSPKYLAYLLRLWQEDDSTPWRATLENAHTGERHGFASLGRLLAFLQDQTGLVLLPDEYENQTPGEED